MIHRIAKVSEEVNRKCPARNTMVQLSALTPNLSTTKHSVTHKQKALSSHVPIIMCAVQSINQSK